MKKLSSLLIFFYIILINFSYIYCEEPPNLNVTSYILIEKNSGTILSEKNSDMKIYPASTTKILTAIVSLENTDLEKKITVTQSAINAIGPGGMNINLQVGEILNLENLLNAMLLSSANEAAYCIAEGSMTDFKTFMNKMNSTSKNLGAVNSNFINPNGMFNENHFSTASDLAIISKYAMQNDSFRNIVSKTSYKLPPTNKHAFWPVLPISNNFVVDNTKSEFYSKVTGIKTGYLSESKRNLCSSAINSDGLELISVIIGANTIAERDNYSKALLEYGFRNFSMQKIISKGEIIKDNLIVNNSKDNSYLTLVSNNDIESILPNDKDSWNIETIENIKTDIKAPINAGQNFGTIEYKFGNISLGKINVVADRSIEKKEIIQVKKLFSHNIMFIFNIFIIIIGITFILRIIKKIIILR
ncbi:MAG: D-alanyl-D-alanine carboxypeptidase family protein [Clostridiales bacterium]